MNISASRGGYPARLTKLPSEDSRSIENFRSTATAKAEARSQVGQPVPIEGAGQQEQSVLSAYTDIRTQQIRGYMVDRLPWSPSVREGLAEYRDIEGQGRRSDEFEALGVDIYV